MVADVPLVTPTFPAVLHKLHMSHVVVGLEMSGCTGDVMQDRQPFEVRNQKK